MNDRSFTTVITVDKTPQEAFRAIVDPRSWWGANIDGITDREGETWSYRCKELHFSRQKSALRILGSCRTWSVLAFARIPGRASSTEA